MSNKWKGNKSISYGNNIVVKKLKPIETRFINSSKWNFEKISSSMRLNYKTPGTSNEEKHKSFKVSTLLRILALIVWLL